MPNHIHLILVLNDQKQYTVSRVIKQYKSCVSKKIGYCIWQKSFYEHIVRNEVEYLNTKEYIVNNVIKWKDDKYF